MTEEELKLKTDEELHLILEEWIKENDEISKVARRVRARLPLPLDEITYERGVLINEIINISRYFGR